MYLTRGLGATTKTVTLGSGRQITVDERGNWIPPTACVMVPFYGWLSDSCKPPSTVELEAAALVGPAMSQANVAALEQQFAQTDAEQCALYPEACAIATNPAGVAAGSVAAVVGDIAEPIGNLASGALETLKDLTGTLKCGLFKVEDKASGKCVVNWTPVIVLAGAGLALTFALTRPIPRRRR